MRSIRWQLVGSYVLIALLATLVVGGLSLSIVSNYFAQQERAQLSASARVAAEDVVDFLWPEPNVAGLRSLAIGYGFLGQTRMVVLSSEGELLADSGPHPWALPHSETPGVVAETEVLERATGIVFRHAPFDAPYPPPLPEALPQEYSPVSIRVLPVIGQTGFALTSDEQGSYLSVRPITSPGYSHVSISTINVKEPIIGPGGGILGYVQLSERPNYSAQTLDSIKRALIWAGLAAVAVASAIGLGISRNLTAPLAELAAAARHMGKGDLSARAEVKRTDEIGELARQFNSMAERLEESFIALAADRDALQRFAADAAHELRTPITALKTFNELLMAKGQNDPEVRHEFLEQTRTQIERLDWLTRNLLDLSKLDTGMLDLNFDEQDLRRLVQHVTASFRPQAQNQGTSLHEEMPPDPAYVALDHARMEQVLTNLVSNALKFTPREGSVTVGLRPGPEQVEVWVQDTGPGIPLEELPHIFERFYRGGQGQTRGGSGLGLAIVKGIVEAHGGEVRVESQPGHGACFTIALPLRRVDTY